MKISIIKYLWVLMMMIFLSSCYNMRVEVHQLPSNTPATANIYITGDFNNWDPGDNNYRLEPLNDSTYFIDLPRGIGELEYKFTRGDWTTVEKDPCGYEIDNRSMLYGGEVGIVVDTIYSWADLAPVDCDKITIVINSLPENTPQNASLQLAGNFTNWDVGGEDYTFTMDSLLGKPVLTVFRPQIFDILQFKVNRGSLERSEGDGLGNAIPPRNVAFGELDTLFIDIITWQDLEQAKEDMITLIVERIPENTPEGDPIFFVGEINDWFPHDQKLRLEQNRQGQYFINLPYRAYEKEYKFTRGSWNSVEKDTYGYEISNRVLHHKKSSDTVYVSIWNWADLSVPLGGEVTIWIPLWPVNTPENADLYIAGNFNNWNPGSDDWIFNRTTAGYYFISVPRQGNILEFKITRGSWDSVEVDKNGEDIENRTYRWAGIEHIEIEVQAWKDIPLEQ